MARSHTSGRSPGPSRKWYVLAAILVIFPPVAFVVTMISIFVSLNAGSVVFEAPGETTVTVDEPGVYMIWRQTSGIDDGVAYNDESPLPEVMTITVVDASSGEPIPVEDAPGTQTQTGETTRESIVEFALPSRGDYRITVAGEFAKPMVFAFSKSVVAAFYGAMLASALMGFVGVLSFLAGLLMFAIVLVMRVNAAGRHREAELRDLGLHE